MKKIHGVLLLVAAVFVYVLVNVGAMVLGLAGGYLSVKNPRREVVYRYRDTPALVPRKR